MKKSDKKKALTKIKKILRDKAIVIPGFIKTTDKLHKDIYDNMFFLTTEIISELLVCDFLSEGVISYIAYTYKSLFNDIIKIDKKLFFHISNYYIDLFIDLENYCLKNELYEILTNIKKFDDVLFDIENDEEL